MRQGIMMKTILTTEEDNMDNRIEVSGPLGPWERLGYSETQIIAYADERYDDTKEFLQKELGISELAAESQARSAARGVYPLWEKK
jgi:hypothetical protein